MLVTAVNTGWLLNVLTQKTVEFVYKREKSRGQQRHPYSEHIKL